MSHPASYGAPLGAPPPGRTADERVLVRVRPRSKGMFFSGLLLIATAAAAGYFFGMFAETWQNIAVLAGAGAIVVLFVLIPWLRWLSIRYIVTTRRVIATSGLFSRVRREYSHTRGYGISLRRGPLQRMTGAGTITLENGIDQRLVLRNIPDARLVQEALVDQIEVNQILAHRDAQSGSLPIVQP